MILIPIDSGLPESLTPDMRDVLSGAVWTGLDKSSPCVIDVVELSVDVAAVNNVCVVLDQLPERFKVESYAYLYVPGMIAAIQKEVENQVREIRKLNQDEL